MEKQEQPIRIAQVIGNWFGGGIESVIMNYYRHIDRSKIQFDFFCSEKSTDIPYKEIEELGGTVTLIPSYSQVFKYQKVLKEKLKGYKIVHCHLGTMAVFALKAAKTADVPVRIVHSHSTSNKQEFVRNLMKNMLRPMSKIYATDYMCCSELAGRWLFGDKVYDEGKVYLLNNAIDLEKFTYNEQLRNRKRKELDIDQDTFVIGHIGRFVEQKNHRFLIDIFNEVHKQIPNSLLLLAGQGPLMDEIKEKVNQLNLKKNVMFLGQRSDVNELFQAMDVFCLPSLYEGLPVVGVEAQASGLPCLFSNDMTKETKVLKTTKFLSLKQNIKEWIISIIQFANSHQRCDTSIEITNKGFNIKSEVDSLEKYYANILIDILGGKF